MTSFDYDLDRTILNGGFDFIRHFNVINNFAYINSCVIANDFKALSFFLGVKIYKTFDSGNPYAITLKPDESKYYYQGDDFLPLFITAVRREMPGMLKYLYDNIDLSASAKAELNYHQYE